MLIDVHDGLLDYGPWGIMIQIMKGESDVIELRSKECAIERSLDTSIEVDWSEHPMLLCIRPVDDQILTCLEFRFNALANKEHEPSFKFV